MFALGTYGGLWRLEEEADEHVEHAVDGAAVLCSVFLEVRWCLPGKYQCRAWRCRCLVPVRMRKTEEYVVDAWVEEFDGRYCVCFCF